eukprot:4937252-Amphidinium_carterae.1
MFCVGTVFSRSRVWAHMSITTCLLHTTPEVSKAFTLASSLRPCCLPSGLGDAAGSMAAS